MAIPLSRSEERNVTSMEKSAWTEQEEEEDEFKECLEEPNGSVTPVFEDSLESNEVEKQKVVIMRAFVEREDSSAKDVDDFMIRRFLRARDLDVEKASAMFLKYLSWRKAAIPNGFISASEISTNLAHNKLFMQGVDKKGRPIVVGYGNRHKQGNIEEFIRYVIFALEKICSRMPRGQEKFVCIGDLQGWGYSNSDIRGYRASLSILQDCYPERLGKLYIVHVPFIFTTAWKMVYPFIDKNTKKKIKFVEDKKLRSTLLSDIDESQLPDVYGGKLSLVPIQDC
ncbi:phosphatidylinositol transfer protein 3-like [Cucurbita maxima]|uniref:Phosphatidylinositol transfer protein 3-like n=1 Tax=Cucurbita maxima TaxID=3661 RepID=A0A6J1I7E9_CUCMA|nr:phosphatidylinositol transfer protein 3-like [Cucurbita maxima]